MMNVSRALSIPFLAIASCIFGCVVGGLAGCAGPPTSPPVYSLDGRRLPDPARAEDFVAHHQGFASAAKSAALSPEGTLDDWVWWGRRVAYLGQYDEAIRIYSEARLRFREDPDPLRHRGHRNITVRRFGQAVQDLEWAAELASDLPDRVEPDGLPNARNQPTSTLKSNIYYHLGLARYLLGDFDGAVAAYNECLSYAKNPDMLCATLHWLYTSLRRAGRHEDARAVLAPVHEGMDIIENHAYHDLLLFYRGERTSTDLVAKHQSADGVQNASLAYGLGRFHLAEGNDRLGTEVLQQIISGDSWAAFGFIAAEADLVEMARRQ